MTDKVNISGGQPNVPRSAAESFHRGGGDYVAATTESLTAQYYSDMSAPPYDAFDHVGTTDLDVTIGSGEAMVRGAAIARDTSTVVSLADNTDGQTVYVGWSHNSTSDVVIGLESAFQADDPRIPAWEFDTASGAVSTSRDQRPVGPTSAQSPQFYAKDQADERFVNASDGGLDSDLDFAGNAAISMAFDTRESRPADPSIGQGVLRTDTVPWQLEIYTTRGWRVRTFEPENLMIENWEDEDRDPWQFDGSGSDEFVAISKDGSTALRQADTRRVVSHPDMTTTLEHYPDRGDKWKTTLQVEEFNGQFRLVFGRDHTDAYATDEHYRLVMFDSGGVELEETGVDTTNTIEYVSDHGITLGDWIEIVVWYDHPDRDAEIDVEIRNLSTGGSVELGGTGDMAHNHRGAELYTNTGAQVVWDVLEIVERTA